MSSINSASSSANTSPVEGEDFDTTPEWNENGEGVENVDSEHRSISPQDRETMEGIRAFGVSMCNLVLRTLPHIPEETVHRCLRCLTTPVESIDPNVFNDVEEEVGKKIVPFYFYQ